MPQNKPYLLKDQALWEDNSSLYRFLVWQPEQIYIILGNSNKIENSVLPQAINDKIPIIKRPTGGEAVILTPKMLILSCIQNTEHLLASKTYFSMYNKQIIQALEYFGVQGLEQEGISDIAFQKRKIVGSAMYRNPKKIFYHAVINVSQTAEIIEKYLCYPQKTPLYRQKRSHKDFVTSLEKEGFSIPIPDLKKILEKKISYL